MPKIVSICRFMLIVQLAKVTALAYTFCRFSCAGQHFPDEPECPKPLFNPSGLTIGDLIDATKDIAMQHRRCPLASGSELDKDGNVGVRTAIHMHIDLSAKDPFVKQHDANKLAAKQKRSEAGRKEQMMAAFAEARYKGKSTERLLQCPRLIEITAFEEDVDCPEFAVWRETYDTEGHRGVRKRRD